MADDVEKKLEEMRRQVLASLSEAQRGLAEMNVVERAFDRTVTSLASLEPELGSFSFIGTPGPPATSEVKGSLQQLPKRRAPNGALRPDEYFGLEPLEAAKLYMKGVGHAVHFDEITDAVQRGGAATKGADWRDKLEISLKRSPYQVITVADKTYGLADFYSEEQLKRFRGRRSPEPAPKKKKLKPKAKPTVKADDSKPKKVTKTPKTTDVAPTGEEGS